MRPFINRSLPGRVPINNAPMLLGLEGQPISAVAERLLKVMLR